MKKQLSDMSDEEIRAELKKKKKNPEWTFDTHDEYMVRINELHKQAMMIKRRETI